MALDGLTLAACVAELKDILPDAKVQKILMPTREEVVLSLYTKARGTFRLALNADAGNCAVYLTANAKSNPKTAPAFCMLLRKHLSSAKITAVSQQGLDRVFILSFEAKDEMMHKTSLQLIAEIMGKHSNIILVREGRVLDSIRRVSVDISSKRQVLPGSAYTPPPTEQYNPVSMSETSLEELVLPARDIRVSGHLTSRFQGMSKQSAEEIIFLSGLDPAAPSFSSTQARILAKTLKAFYTKALTDPKPCIQLNDQALPVFFSVIPYQTYPKEGRLSFETANEMLDYYYTKRETARRLSRKKETLGSLMKKAVAKLNKKIKIYLESLEEAKKADVLTNRAQMITANIYRLHKGMNRFEAADFISGDPVSIPLDITLTPAQNAQKLFKKATKLKTAEKINTRQLKIAVDERDSIENMLMYIQKAESLSDLDEIAWQMEKGGLLSSRHKKGKASPPPESKPREFLSPSGYTILVGKNDRQNDIVTMRLADKSDIWFHAKNIPGSHVLLQTHGTALEQLDDETVLMAASLAAKYSSAVQSGKTPVDYTQRQNVKKPPGSRPGKVIYDHYFTVYVEPF
jgi:predicted ribosome quality control (RQC) complex YloA/Tae2 family protein